MADELAYSYSFTADVSSFTAGMESITGSARAASEEVKSSMEDAAGSIEGGELGGALEWAKELINSLGEDAQGAGESISEAFTGAGRGVEEAVGQMGEMRGGIMGIVSAIAPEVLGLAALAGALRLATKETSDSVHETIQLSIVMGTSAERARAWMDVSEQLGVEQGTLTRGVAMLGSEMRHAAQGNAEAEKKFVDLGVSIRDTEGALRPLESVFGDTLSRIRDLSMQGNALAGSEVFGGRMWARMAPLISITSQQIADQTEDVRKYGTVNRDTIRDVLEMQAAEARLKEAFLASEAAVSRNVMPTMTAFSEWLTSQFKSSLSGAGKSTSILTTVLNYAGLAFMGIVAAAKIAGRGLEDFVVFADHAATALKNITEHPMSAGTIINAFKTQTKDAFKDIADYSEQQFIGINTYWDKVTGNISQSSRTMAQAVADNQNIGGGGFQDNNDDTSKVEGMLSKQEEEYARSYAELDKIHQRFLENENRLNASSADAALPALKSEESTYAASYEQRIGYIHQLEGQQIAAAEAGDKATEQSLAREIAAQRSMLAENVGIENQMVSEYTRAAEQQVSEHARITSQMQGESERFKDAEAQLTAEGHANKAAELDQQLVKFQTVIAAQLALIDQLAAAEQTALLNHDTQAAASAERQIKIAQHETEAIIHEQQRQMQEFIKDIRQEDSEWKKAWKDMGNTANHALTQYSMAVLAHSHKAQEVFRNAVISMETTLLNSCIKMVEDVIWSEIKKLAIYKMVETAINQIKSQGASSGQAIEKASAAESAGTNAATAAGGAAAAVAPTPFIGPVLAVAAAAEMFALVGSYGAERGFDVPPGSSPLTLLHPREMVLPDHLADTVRNISGTTSRGGSGGNTTHNHFQFSAIDAKSVSDMLRRNGPELANIVALMRRSGMRFNAT